MNNSVKILFLGDVIGSPGRRVLSKLLAKGSQGSDLIIANVENCTHGFGVTKDHIIELKEMGVNVFTGGNHTFDRKEIFGFIDDYENLLRPANYPTGTAGKGWCLIDIANAKIGVINLQGRVFMEPLMSPFLVADQIIEKMATHTKIIIVDIHAEATAEKVAIGHYLDGRVSAVIGTHTHIQTADEKILPQGTAYLTDAGCCGPIHGVIGMEKEGVFRRLVEQLPARLTVAAGPAAACGVEVTVNKQTGKAESITRLRFAEE